MADEKYESALREDNDLIDSDDEADRIKQETISNALEMEEGDFQTYVHALYEYVKQYLTDRGSSLLDRCTFPAFFEYCRAERLGKIRPQK